MEIETENVNYIIYFPGWLNLGNIWLRMLASSPGGGGGGVLPYISYIGTLRQSGYHFQEFHIFVLGHPCKSPILPLRLHNFR